MRRGRHTRSWCSEGRCTCYLIMHCEYVEMCLVCWMNVPVVDAHAQQVNYIEPNLELYSPTTHLLCVVDAGLRSHHIVIVTLCITTWYVLHSSLTLLCTLYILLINIVFNMINRASMTSAAGRQVRYYGDGSGRDSFIHLGTQTLPLFHSSSASSPSSPSSPSPLLIPSSPFYISFIHISQHLRTPTDEPMPTAAGTTTRSPSHPVLARPS